MHLEVGVKVLLKNEEGKYLLVRRNPKKYPEAPASWDIVGGRIEAGISLIENLRREVKEEVDLDLVDIPKLVYSQDILHIIEYPDRHVVRLTYTANITGGPKVDFENLECKWFTWGEILALPKEELDRFFAEVIKSRILQF